MFLEDALKLIKEAVQKIDTRYGDTVFNECVVVTLSDRKDGILSGRIIDYSGPRKEDFQRNFETDLAALCTELSSSKHSVGDFEFVRDAKGTNFDAFIVAGEDIFLICNNTRKSMDEISSHPRWLNAQVPFAELAERFRFNPVFIPA